MKCTIVILTLITNCALALSGNSTLLCVTPDKIASCKSAAKKIPELGCVEGEDVPDCLHILERGIANVTITPDGFPHVVKWSGLKTIALAYTPKENAKRFYCVINNENKDIKSPKDLKGKGVCLPKYGGDEYAALKETLQKYGISLEDDLGPSCIPGANDDKFHKSDLSGNSSEKSCSLCVPPPHGTHTTCNANANDNTYYGNDGALVCLENSGHFAILEETAIMNSNNRNNFKILCSNGKITPVTNNIPDDCALKIVQGAPIVAKGSPENIENYILVMEKVFEFQKSNPEINIYPNKTIGLSTKQSNSKFLLDGTGHAPDDSMMSNSNKISTLPLSMMIIPLIILGICT